MAKQSKLTGAISLSGAQAIVLLFGYMAHLWIGRVLGPGPYGIYGVVLSVQTIIGLFLTLGVPSAVSRFVAQNEESAQSILRQALQIQLKIAAALAIVTALLAPILARLLNDTSLTPYLLFMAMVVFSQALFPVFVQFLSGMHFFNKQAALTSLYATAKLVGAVSLIYFFGVYGAFGGFAIGGIIAAIAGWHWTKSLGGKHSKELSLKTFLSFAGIYALILVGLQILMSLDLFMVKSITQDDVQAGYYNAAVTLSRISYVLLQGLAFIILPSVSALTKPGASHKKAAAFIKNTLRYLIALIIPAITLAAATSRELIILFFSHEYAPAAPVLTILMVGLGGLAFYLLLINIVAGAGKAKVGLIATVVLLGISSALGAILIPRFGLSGAAWQTTITSLSGLAFLSLYTFRTFNIPLPIKSTLNVAIATAAAVAPVYIWTVTPLALPLQYIALLGIYVLALFLLGEITKQDRQYFASIHPALRWIAA